jgi:hypothetical protein
LIIILSDFETDSRKKHLTDSNKIFQIICYISPTYFQLDKYLNSSAIIHTSKLNPNDGKISMYLGLNERRLNHLHTLGYEVQVFKS